MRSANSRCLTKLQNLYIWWTANEGCESILSRFLRCLLITSCIPCEFSHVFFVVGEAARIGSNSQRTADCQAAIGHMDDSPTKNSSQLSEVISLASILPKLNISPLRSSRFTWPDTNCNNTLDDTLTELNKVVATYVRGVWL